MSLELITDRTQTDYQDWLQLSKIPWASMTEAQRAIWSVPMKGAYNYTDLNRVGEALEYLQELFADFGYTVEVNVRTNWMPGEWPTVQEMNAYVQSIKNMRSVLTMQSGTPAAPFTMNDCTVTIWNNIEQILLNAEALLAALPAGFRHTGLSSCGQGGLIT